MSVQNEEDDQVCDSRQDDGRGAQSRSSHEELACCDRVAQAGDLAEGQSHSNARQSVSKPSNLDEARAPHHKDKGESKIDEDIVG